MRRSSTWYLYRVEDCCVWRYHQKLRMVGEISLKLAMRFKQIINEAKRQLLSPRGSMKEIAFHLGFDNIAHFSKYFKTKTGMNFSSFRQELERGN